MRRIIIFGLLLTLTACNQGKIQKARYQFHNRDFQGSEKEYKSILSSRLAYPSRFQAEVGVIWTLYHQNDFPAALAKIADLRRDFKTVIPDDWLLIIESFCHFNLGNYAAALTTVDRLTGNFPDSAWREDAFYLAGRSYEIMKRYGEAETAYEEFLKVYQSPLYLKDVLLGYYTAVFVQKKYERALQLLETYLDYFPDELKTNLEFLYDLGFLCGETGRTAEAVRYYEQYLRADGRLHRYEIIYFLAKYYADNDDAARAARYYNTILRDLPDFSERQLVRLWLGNYYLRQKQFDPALEHFRFILAEKGMNEYFEEALFRIPQIEELQYRFNDAVLDYARYLTYYPDGRFAPAVHTKITELSLHDSSSKTRAKP